MRYRACLGLRRVRVSALKRRPDCAIMGLLRGYNLFEEVVMRVLLICVLLLCMVSSAQALEVKAYQMREDFGQEPLYDCSLQYYYYIPCPTYSWFWAFSGWSQGDIVGTCFTVGDQGTGGFEPCDEWLCQGPPQVIRMLDLAGYGTVYPGLFTIELDLYCAEECCGQEMPVVHMWHSGPLETHFGWNYITDADMVSLTPCWMPTYQAIFVITATMTGSDARYPAWACDNMSQAAASGCPLHDIGCLPAVAGRNPCGTEEPMVHSGYFGTYPFEHWPPMPFCDGSDSTPDCSIWGAVELAWRVDLMCGGPVAGEPTSWGSIKSMYR